MRISDRLRLAMLIPILLTIVIALALTVAYSSVRELITQQALAVHITGDLNELNDLAHTYLFTYEERPRRQFMLIQEEIQRELKTAKRQTPDHQREIDAIANDVRLANNLFLRLVENRGRRDRLPSSEIYEEAEKRISGQLVIHARNAYAEAASLTAGLSADLISLQRRAYLLFGVATLIAALSIIGILLAVLNDIIRSLTELRTGTEMVATGDLDYRIGLKQPDELGELARSFDHMSERLQSVSVSRDLLESEVEERKRAAEAARRELARTTVLREIASIATSLDLAGLTANTLQTLEAQVAVKVGLIYQKDEYSNELVCLVSRGVPRDMEQLMAHIPADASSAVGRAFVTKQVAVYSSAELPLPSATRTHAVASLADWWTALPLSAGGEVTGVMLLGLATQVRVEENLETLRGVADQLGIGIENARLYQSEHEAARLGEALARIDRDIHSSLRVEEIVEGALREGAKAIGASSAAIDGISDGGWVVWYDWGFDHSIVGDTYTDEENPHGVLSAETGNVIAIEDAYTDDRVNNDTMKSYGLKSAIVAPLIARGEAVACLYYNYHEAIHRFTSTEIEFVGRVASSLSLAIENSRLYEVERTIADRLQESLLSLPSEVQGIEFSHAYHSASEEARVGGDFYDLFEVRPGLVAITIGDVAGKGIDAAVLTSLVKNTIRAHASEKGAAPAQILTLTNDVVFKSTASEAFVTVFFGILDYGSGRFTYCSAGHTTSVLLHSDGKVGLLLPTGPILGAFMESRFDETGMCCLQGDDLLFLYTDGLTEARYEMELYGEERLFAFLSTQGGRGTEEVVQATIDEILRFTDDRLSDDMALLAVRLSDPASPTVDSQKLNMTVTDRST